jgi:hypothetical protein
MKEERARHLDRLLGIVDGHVDVQAEDELAARDVLKLVDEIAVAVAGGDPLALEKAEGMRAGGADAHAAFARDPAHEAPQLAELSVHVCDALADRRRNLDHRLHELRSDAVGQLAVLCGGEDCVHVLHEIEALAVEEHVLLLDSEGVLVARSEAVVEHAAAGGKALPSDRGRIDLFHGP